ncbi:hypothetical protein ACFVWG_18025 [Kribbella sp. NPDC058245]|uniref:hypothetical protein n=1 Tax=Kribbella sp. NPDC058245 TaxID=3346399 RepID=UPI0036E48987
MPLLALWGEHGFVGRNYDVLNVWSDYATNVVGHSLPEEQPILVATLRNFFADTTDCT